MKTGCFLLVVLLLLWAGSTFGGVPEKISFQGYVTDLSQTPISGEHVMGFKIYDSQILGNLLWSDVDTLELSNGQFHAYLGDNTPLPAGIFSGDVLWLETAIDGSAVPTRQPLVSVAYSFRAQKADTAAYAISAPASGDTCLWLADGTNAYRATGSVGIGETSPNQKLSVTGMLGIHPQPWVLPTSRGLFLYSDSAEGGSTIYAYNYPALDADKLELGGKNIVLSTYIGGHSFHRLFLANDGNVGVGTDNPTAMLDVSGHLAFSSTSLYGYAQYAYHDVTVGGGQSELRWIRISYQNGSPLRFTVFRYTHENGSWSGQLAATISTTIGDWGSLLGYTFIRVEKAEYPNHLLRKVVSCEGRGAESGIYLQVLGGRTYHFSGLPGTPTDVGSVNPSCPIGNMALDLGYGPGVWVGPSLTVSGDISSGGTIYGNFSGTIDNALHWNGHSWGDTYPYSSNSDQVDGVHGTQLLRTDQSGSISGSLSVGTSTAESVVEVTNQGSGKGLYAVTNGTGGGNAAVYGKANSGGGVGVYGETWSLGTSGGSSIPVYGWAPASGASVGGAALGVLGRVNSYQGGEGTSVPVGVFGWATSSSGVCWGVAGETESNAVSACGVKGKLRHPSATGRAIWGEAPSTGYAGYFDGKVHITGTLSKGGGGFKIDHPLDPDGKYLNHSFVESPDMMNIYNGNCQLDANGEAWVQLPDWFEALNRDFRYQLTPIGAPAPNLHIAQEIVGNRLRIGGGTPRGIVSWQVSGIRKDDWANTNRIQVEELKAQ